MNAFALKPLIMKKVLFVVSSHSVKGETGEPTGYYLGEVSYAWSVLYDAGIEVDFVSPKGGEAPGEGLDFSDPVNKKFWYNQEYRSKILNTLTPAEVNVEQYVAIYYAGGHGTMWDFANNEELQQITKQIYEAGGFVGAVCHGSAGLLNVRLSNGDLLVKGKRVNTFTNEEERAVKLEGIVPYMLETEMRKRDVLFESSGLWEPHVAVDGRLVTGQNPASAKGVGEALLQLINLKNVV